MTDQEKLDKAARLIRRLINQANEGADEYCAKGDARTSADLREVAAHLSMAHAVGRRIGVDGGGIRPRAGDK